jgi:hypothetical protein
VGFRKRTGRPRNRPPFFHPQISQITQILLKAFRLILINLRNLWTLNLYFVSVPKLIDTMSRFGPINSNARNLTPLVSAI